MSCISRMLRQERPRTESVSDRSTRIRITTAVELSATAIDPALIVTPPGPHDFGDQPIGASEGLSITLISGTADPLWIHDITLSTGNPSDFSLGTLPDISQPMTQAGGFLTAVNPQALEAADLNGDGWMDLVVGKVPLGASPGQNQWLRNNSNYLAPNGSGDAVLAVAILLRNWASMLVVRWEDFWPASHEEAAPDLAQLATRICPMIEQDRDMARRVEDEIDFDTRLELVGPGRLLRALGSVPGVRHVAVAGSKRSVEIDIADNSIVGAYATLHEGTTQTLQGMPALLALWGLNSGRVSVREQDLPSVANIMIRVTPTAMIAPWPRP